MLKQTSPSAAKNTSVRPPIPQQSGRRLVGLGVCGVLTLLGSFWYRQHILAARHPQPLSIAAQARPLLDELIRLKAAVQRNPRDAAAQEALATFYQQHGMVPEALFHWRELMHLKPDDPKSGLQIAALLLIMGQEKPSLQAYESLTQHWPNSAEAWQGLSIAHFHKNDYLDAMNAAQRAYRLNPKDDGNKLALAAASLNYALQFSYTDLYAAQYGLAQSLLKDLSKTMPNDPAIHFMLGHALRMMRRYADAIVSLRRSLELDPNNPRAITELARACAFSGDRITARKVVEDAIQRGIRNADVYGMDAQLISQSGDPDSDVKSIAMLEKAIEADPLDLDYLERLGSAYTRVNRLDDARKVFERVAKTNPDVAFPYQQLAMIYARMGEKERSAKAAVMATRMAANENQLRQLQLVTKVHPENINLHLALGERYVYLKMPGPAKEQFLLALRNDPHSARAHKGLATLEKTAAPAVGRAMLSAAPPIQPPSATIPQPLPANNADSIERKGKQ